MNTVRRHLRFSTWLALFAIAALVLLPTLSRAMAPASGGAYTEVCTPQGMKIVALADGEQSPDGAQLRLEHCPWCTAALGDLAPPPVVAQPPLPAQGAAAVPAAFLHAPTTLHAWAHRQPRAPPVLS